MFHTVIPNKIRLEASSRCQLRCPSCPTASKAIHPVVGAGALKLDDFIRLIDENPWIKEIELSNYGEIFLNPHLLNIIKYAYERGVSLSAANGVNLNNVKEDVLEGIVKYKLRRMTVSIDGASEEIYKIYRVRGNYNTVIENIKKINRYKEIHKSEYPLLSWQFVVFGHNEHEIPAARRLAGELNMRFYVKLSWDDQLSPIRDREYVKKEAQLDAVTRDEYKQTHGVDYMQRICSQLWAQPQINWDGKILGCCRNFWGDFGGNAFKEGALKSLNNEKIVYARRMLFGEAPPRDDIPCSTCEIYLDMKARGGWLTRTPLSLSRNALWFLRESIVWCVVMLSRVRGIAIRARMLSLLLLVSWLSPIQAAPASLEVIGQQEQKLQPASPNGKNTQERAEKRGQNPEGGGTDQIRGQNKVEAVNLLGQALDEIALLEDDSDESIRWKSLILPKIAELVWDSNKERVKEVYIGTIRTFLNNYERGLADGNPRKTAPREKTLEEALKRLIKGIEARDKEAAQKLWSRFYSLRKASLEKQSNPLKSMAEYAALSREALEYDIQGSMEIARAMLSSGVPPSFVQLLLDLKSRDKMLADELFKYSLGQLAKGVYGPRQAIILSHYAFQEDLFVLPTPDIPSNEQISPETRFGILANLLRGIDPRPSPELATLYINAVFSNLSLTDFANVTKQSYVGEALFLVKKLEGYAGKLGLKTGGDWKSLLQKINSASERLGLGAREVAQLTSLAEKTVTDAKQVFQPGEGIKERVAKAAEAKSPTDRTASYSSVIRDLADNQNFDEAQKLLSSLTDKATKEKMSDYILFRQVQLMIEHQEWDTLAGQIERIGAVAPRFYLLISAAQAAEKKAEDEHAKLLLQEAVKLIKLTEAEDDQAKMLLAVASVSGPKAGPKSEPKSEKDEYKSQRMFDGLSAAIRQLNDRPAYDYKDYEMKLFLDEKSHYSYSLQRTDLESCFEQLAKANWENAKILASYLNSKRLRLSAQIAQCRSILRK